MLWLRSILRKKRFWLLLSIGSLGMLILSKYEPPVERLRRVQRWEIRQHRRMARLVEKQMHQIQTTPIQLKPSVSLEVLRDYLLQNKLGQLYKWSQENHQKKRDLSIHKMEYELGRRRDLSNLETNLSLRYKAFERRGAQTVQEHLSPK